jgi:hypothetical protein
LDVFMAEIDNLDVLLAQILKDIEKKINPG